ncbi:MAG: hypothetical protein V3U44_11045 [Alphaproteobacteria bacterium]
MASIITAVNDNRPTAIPAGGLNETYLYGANDNRPTADTALTPGVEAC